MSSSQQAVVIVLFVGLAAPMTVTAQLTKPQAGVAGGATFPVGDFYSLREFNPGWQGITFISSRIRHSSVALRVAFSYSENTSNLAINGVATERRDKFFGEDADLTVSFPLSSAPPATGYLLAGPGLYSVSESVTQYGGAEGYPEGTKFAFNVGGGFTVGRLFFEIRYVRVEGSGSYTSWAFVPINVGFRFGNW